MNNNSPTKTQKSETSTFSPQAIIQTVILGILSIIYAYGVAVNYSASQLVFFILWLLLAAISIYDTQCLVSGNCAAWSWIRTILLCILPIVIIINYFVSLKLWKEKQEQEKISA